jgi:xylulokinase
VSRALIAGVDSSTQSTKVELRDADTGALVATGRAAHPPTHPPRSEQHPDDWWAALVAAMGQCGDDRSRVAAIAVAGQQHGLVCLDGDERVLRAAPLWNDTSGAAHAERMVARLGRQTWADACGSVPLASFTIAKLAWLAATEPDVLDATEHVLLPHDELNRRLTGRHTTDRGDASGTGWWSPAEGRYRMDLLDLAAPDTVDESWLPEVLGPTESPGTITPDAAAALGIPGTAVVGPGTGDNMAAALGLGLRAGDVAVSLGTSGTVFTTSDQPTADPSGAVAGFADATGRYLPLVCTLNATGVTDAIARLMGVDLDEFDQLALSIPTGASKLTLLPYLSGERTPDRPNATGVLAGLRPDVERAQVARAAVEGVLCGLLDGYDALVRQLDQPPGGDHLLVGGGARSPAYRQVLADLTGRAWLAVTDEETVARGAAAQAAAVLHGSTVDEVVAQWGRPPSTMVHPGDRAGGGRSAGGGGSAGGGVGRRAGGGADAAATVRDAYARLRDRS